MKLQMGTQVMPDVSLLSQMFDAYMRLDPREVPNAALSAHDDVDVDLWEEDAYLAGLVKTVLLGRLPQVRAISLSPLIDERLAKLANHAPPDTRPRIEAYVRYRRAMRELAQELSRITGLKVLP